MKIISKITILICISFFTGGCSQTSNSIPARLPAAGLSQIVQPAGLKILPLTKIVTENNVQVLKAYVSITDCFGDYIKSGAIFRFELYQHVSRSAEPKGARLVIWPDIDLTQPAQNQQYWKDFLRCYEFELELGPVYPQNYLLQVTCICPAQVRLITEYTL